MSNVPTPEQVAAAIAVIQAAEAAREAASAPVAPPTPIRSASSPRPMTRT